jgi:hypothetical protein
MGLEGPSRSGLLCSEDNQRNLAVLKGPRDCDSLPKRFPERSGLGVEFVRVVRVVGVAE